MGRQTLSMYFICDQYDVRHWEYTLHANNRMSDTENILYTRPIGCQTLSIYSLRLIITENIPGVRRTDSARAHKRELDGQRSSAPQFGRFPQRRERAAGASDSPKQNSGTQRVNSGTQRVNSGTQRVDSGTQGLNSGTQRVDSGTRGVDSGTQGVGWTTI
jgi:X-X-X-Leu-X-X-Gly heptad repeat protein